LNFPELSVSKSDSMPSGILTHAHSVSLDFYIVCKTMFASYPGVLHDPASGQDHVMSSMKNVYNGDVTILT